MSSSTTADAAQSALHGHLLTVNVEDYFQVGAFRRFITPDHWYRFEPRLNRNVDTVLQLLRDHDVKATFFVLGWIAERDSGLVKRIAAEGHEVASRGYLHQPLTGLTRPEICKDVLRARQILEDVTGDPVYGFRLSDGWLSRKTLWLLDILAGAGYAYDSSLMPRQKDFGADGTWRFIRTVETQAGPIIEVPLSTIGLPGGWLPIAGGNYHRQVPDFLMRRLVARSVRNETRPFVMYFQVWELDDQQPEISVADRLTRLRHYRKLGKYRRTLPQYLQQYRFTSIRRHAEADTRLQAVLQHSRCSRQIGSGDSSVSRTAGKDSAIKASQPECLSGSFNKTTPNQVVTPVTLVIPCYNEEKTIPYLANTLASVCETINKSWQPRLLFVDDCSTDATYETLQQTFRGRTDVTILRHEMNKGVSAAILTGIRAAETDIVASIDCDCSYDPHELAKMLPLLAGNVSMVTASPYHHDGHVRNVPAWRLVLSRGLSALYQVLLRHSLATWTSCFRVYRRRHVLDLPLREPGFLGTAELAAELVLHGREIAEYPTTLEVRLFGVSKMKTIRAILSHLRLLGRTAVRLMSSRTSQHVLMNDSCAQTRPLDCAAGEKEKPGELHSSLHVPATAQSQDPINYDHVSSSNC